MSKRAWRSEGFWTAAALLSGVLVPIVLGVQTCSITKLLVTVDEFSTSLWLIVFAVLWFWYRTLLRREEEGKRRIAHEASNPHINIDQRRTIAKAEHELMMSVRNAKPGVFAVEAGALIATAISGLAKILLWMMKAGTV